MAFFADDVSFISCHRNKLIAEKELQRAVTAVTEWSTCKKMGLNADKCEVTFFSTNSHEANWQPTFFANDTRLLHNPQLKFLGVKLDRLLTFSPHIQVISTKAAVNCPVLTSLTSVRMDVYNDEHVQRCAAQPPYLRGSGVGRCQGKALRVVTGQLKFTSVETLRREASICSIVIASKRATALAYEKAHRLPPAHPRRQLLSALSRHRLKRSSWLSAAQTTTSN